MLFVAPVKVSLISIKLHLPSNVEDLSQGRAPLLQSRMIPKFVRCWQSHTCTPISIQCLAFLLLNDKAGDKKYCANNFGAYKIHPKHGCECEKSKFIFVIYCVFVCTDYYQQHKVLFMLTQPGNHSSVSIHLQHHSATFIPQG